VPPVPRIAAALRNGGASAPAGWVRTGPGWRRFLAALPGGGAALLPVGTCPACWPAYAGILGPLGLAFLLESSYLLPVTIGLLGLAVFSLAFRPTARRGYGPLVLGLASVCFILVFKFAYLFDQLVYAGLFGLVAASAWNAWPKSRSATGCCPKCIQGGAVD
jgi:hypothetical protein